MDRPTRDRELATFLEWALPRLGLRPGGYPRVRGQVGKRLRRRLVELGLPDLAAYRHHLEQRPEEWPRLDALCRITISRFWRDPEVWEGLVREVLPTLAGLAAAAGRARVAVWSAGCASGEEPYSVVLAWSEVPEERRAGRGIEVLATDASAALVRRAAAATYEPGTLRWLPPVVRERAFTPTADGRRQLHPDHRRPVTLAVQDVRGEPPAGPFDLLLCRNLVLTYLDEAGQRAVLARLLTRLRPGGALVIGRRERLPEGLPGGDVLAPWPGTPAVWRRA